MMSSQQRRSGGSGSFQRAPMKAAASAAASASSMPESGAMPAARNSAARASGMFSGSDATTAVRPPVAFAAFEMARTAMSQSAPLQRSSRGKSSTSSERSKPQPIMAEKVVAISASFAQTKVW